MPLTAIQLLWLNVVTDGVQDMALSFEKSEKDILNEQPRNPKDSIFDKALVVRIAFSGIVITAITFAAWAIMMKSGLDPIVARSYIMCLIVFIQNIHVFNCRSEQSSVFSIPLRNSLFILFGVVITLILQIVVTEEPFFANLLGTKPIDIAHLLELLAIAALVLPAVEAFKAILRTQKNRLS